MADVRESRNAIASLEPRYFRADADYVSSSIATHDGVLYLQPVEGLCARREKTIPEPDPASRNTT